MMDEDDGLGGGTRERRSARKFNITHNIAEKDEFVAENRAANPLHVNACQHVLA